MIPIGDDGRRMPFPFVVYAIVAINIWVYLQEVNAGPGADAFINAFAAIPYDVTRGVVLPPPSPPISPRPTPPVPAATSCSSSRASTSWSSKISG